MVTTICILTLRGILIFYSIVFTELVFSKSLPIILALEYTYNKIPPQIKIILYKIRKNVQGVSSFSADFTVWQSIWFPLSRKSSDPINSVIIAEPREKEYIHPSQNDQLLAYCIDTSVTVKLRTAFDSC